MITLGSSTSSTAPNTSLTHSGDVTVFLRAIADETRRMIVQALARSDLRAGELGAIVGAPSNALAFHLKRLSALGLLRRRPSSADARDVYYHLDVTRLRALYAAAGVALYPGMLSAHFDEVGDQTHQPTSQRAASSVASASHRSGTALSQPLRVLFLCTHNSARSQMAEALLRQMGGDQVEVFSAGSQPQAIPPETIATLQERGIPTDGLHPKPLNLFVNQSFDYIITVCDRVREVCPAFTGNPAQAHWSIPDPMVIEDSELRAKAFRDILGELQTRIRYLLLLPHPATGERFEPLAR